MESHPDQAGLGCPFGMCVLNGVALSMVPSSVKKALPALVFVSHCSLGQTTSRSMVRMKKSPRFSGCEMDKVEGFPFSLRQLFVSSGFTDEVVASRLSSRCTQKRVAGANASTRKSDTHYTHV